MSLAFLVVSSFMAIVIYHNGSNWDPIKEIQELKSHNRRDDALDLTRFLRENQTDNLAKYADLEKDLEYTTSEKLRSFAWNGVIRGQVYDTYSGSGAVASDFLLIGDIRDLGIQCWKLLFDQKDFDGFIALLSGAGIGLTSVTLFDGINALSKNTVKFVKRIPVNMNKGMLKAFVKGELPAKHSKAIWDLFKKTAGLYPEQHPAYPISTTRSTLTLQPIL